MNWTAVGLFASYLALFAGALGVFIWWGRRQRKRRAPFKRETKLLRHAGESLRLKLVELDDQSVTDFMFAAFLPLVLGIVIIQIGVWIGGAWLLGCIILAALVFAVAVAACAKWAARKLFIRANYELGWYGERVVGDALAPLERDGWRVFHDFPRSVKGQNFNIDHIAVGPGGIFAIETKTARKGEARPGKEPHVVEFNGSLLSWPWAENRLGIDQALDNAQWLEDWLNQLTGKNFVVRAMLVFPDWMVRDSKTGPLRVVSSSLVAPVLAEQCIVLSRDEIDSVARLVEDVCRDVEY